MLPFAENVKLSHLLNEIAFDYFKTSAILYNLNFLDSRIVSMDDFSAEISNVLEKASSSNIVELINFIEAIDTIVKKTTFGNSNTFRNDIFVFDFETIYQMDYVKMNSIFEYIEEAYPDVIELLTFLKKQTEIEYKNYKRKLINTINKKAVKSTFEDLQSSKQVQKFLEDFKPLTKDIILKQVNSLYSSFIVKDDTVKQLKDTSQMSFIILNGANIIVPISYFASQGKLDCGGDCRYSISDFSQIALISQHNAIESSAKSELIPVNNFAMLRRSVICSNAQKKLLHFIRSSILKGEINQDKNTEKYTYEFLTASGIAELTSSSDDTSSFLAMMQYVNFAKNLKDASEEIEKEIAETILNEDISVSAKLIELELYMQKLAIQLMGGIKIKNKNDNVAFYNALNSLLKKETTKYIERCMHAS